MEAAWPSGFDVGACYRDGWPVAIARAAKLSGCSGERS